MPYHSALALSADKEMLQTVDMSEVVVILLGGGQGSRLYPLTRKRAKPAVSFGGKYRLIDISLTNCLNSKCEKIFILTQFNSFSLNRHIWQTYSREMPRDSFIDVLAAQQTMDNSDWFQGTADAVRQSLPYILTHQPKHVLILCADQIYSLDYRALMAWHLEHEADVTIAAHHISEADTKSLGVIKVDSEMRVMGFKEKPQNPNEIQDFQLTSSSCETFTPDRPYLGSLGMYLFNTEILLQALHHPSTDLSKGAIPDAASRCYMSCFCFDGYWEDVGTVEAFYRANMEWREGKGISDIFQQGNSIITHSRKLPPSRIDGTIVRDSLISDGCLIRAKEINRCIVGVRARVGPGTVIEDSLIMGNDRFKADGTFEIGENCIIRHAIIDKNAVIGAGCVIENVRGIQNADTDLFTFRSGIVVIPGDAVIPSGTRI